MTDLGATIAPKTDQLNSDDLITGPKTIRVFKVTATSAPEQPIAINYEGDGGKPYKPGKSMRRVLVQLWGRDGNGYVGRSMTLFRDEKVIFGGAPVGGIRISHMTHITESKTMALTASKTVRKLFTVEPLVVKDAPPDTLLPDAATAAARGMTAYTEFWKVLTKPQQATLLPDHERLKVIAAGVDATPADKAADDEKFPGGRA